MTIIHYSPIGFVRTDCPDDEVPRRRREIVSTIVVEPALEDALTGIDAFSHLIVLFHMHRASADRQPLVVHPRGDPSLPQTGVLAARGRNHPNPIGLAVVELLERERNALRVRRLDAYDGTPVIDIKPYDHYDVFTGLRLPAWLAARPGNA
ncbi:MAG: tRNA (N6-threonylcarbamoyladenosine(37)-N6)-methyltransferase TrmO [Gammaproteobacteria bacterium]